MRSVLALAAGLALLASPVLAQTDLTRASRGYAYFHRQGADLARHDEAMKGCVKAAAHAAQADPHSLRLQSEAPVVTPEQDIADLLLTPVLTGSIAKGVNSDADAANVENCMVVRGWSVVSLDPKEGAALAKLPADQQRAALAGWLAADAPHGVVIRRFANDLTLASTKYEGRPGGVDKLSLSIAAFGQMPDPSRQRVPRPNYYKLLESGRTLEAVPETGFDTLGPAETLVVFRVVRGSSSDFTGLHFSLSPNRSSIAVHQPNSSMWKKATEAFYVFKVSPGRWRMEKLRSMLDIQSSVSLCLGSPGFDVAEGQAVYGGTLAISGEGRFTPRMDLETARQGLSAHPALAARLKPAAWVNGTTATCGLDSYLYAVEMPGAPFVEGYQAGSQAQAAP